MQNKELRETIIGDVCKERGIDPAIIRELMALEGEHRDLLAWGSRPNFRRDISAIVERELARRRTEEPE